MNGTQHKLSATWAFEKVLSTLSLVSNRIEAKRKFLNIHAA
jgi:hypothetical protein